MDRIRIFGGRRLNGTIPISGAKNATLHFGLGDVYEQQRKYQLALAQFKSALAITPNDLTTQAKLAEVQAALSSH